MLAKVEQKDGHESCAVLAYLQEHNEKANVAGLFSLFENYAAGGASNLTKKQFHPAKAGETDIWRFGKGKVRIYCFFDGDAVIVATHGARKDSQETSAKNMADARKIRDEYFAEKERGLIEIAEQRED